MDHTHELIVDAELTTAGDDLASQLLTGRRKVFSTRPDLDAVRAVRDQRLPHR